MVGRASDGCRNSGAERSKFWNDARGPEIVGDMVGLSSVESVGVLSLADRVRAGRELNFGRDVPARLAGPRDGAAVSLGRLRGLRLVSFKPTNE